jgi:hypothetical protein
MENVIWHKFTQHRSLEECEADCGKYPFQCFVVPAAQYVLHHRILIKIHFGELGQTVGTGMNLAKRSRDCETNSAINFLGDLYDWVQPTWGRLRNVLAVNISLQKWMFHTTEPYGCTKRFKSCTECFKKLRGTMLLARIFLVQLDTLTTDVQ